MRFSIDFEYDKVVSSVYSEECDKYFEETKTVTYTADETDIKDALSEILKKKYFNEVDDEKINEGIFNLIGDNDYMIEQIAEYYYDDLWEHFRGKV